MLIEKYFRISVELICPEEGEAVNFFRELCNNVGNISPIKVAVKSIVINDSKAMNAPVSNISPPVDNDRPIIIDTNGALIAGKPQLEALKANKCRTVYAIVLDLTAVLMGINKKFAGVKLTCSEIAMIACHLECLIGCRQGQRHDFNLSKKYKPDSQQTQKDTAITKNHTKINETKGGVVGKSPQLKPLKNDIKADLVIKSTLLSSKQTAQVYTMMSGEKTRDFIARYLGVYEKTLRKYKTVTYTGIADLGESFKVCK